MAKKYITTTQAAKILGLAPDTILKWAKSDKIQYIRTTGGHFRIDSEEVMSLKHKYEEEDSPEKKEKKVNENLHCWEFHSLEEDHLTNCKKCLVYQVRAEKCYELKKAIGNMELFEWACSTTCTECAYYKYRTEKKLDLLIVSSSSEILKFLAENDMSPAFHVRLTDSGYNCSAILENYKPDFLILDLGIGFKRAQILMEYFLSDPRVPYTKLIITHKSKKVPFEIDYNHTKIFGFIPLPFTIGQLLDFTASEGIQQKLLK